MPTAYLSAILAAFLTAVLSGLGIGSAGIFVLYLTLVAGYAQPEAQALNLLFFLLSAGVQLMRVLDAHLLRRFFGAMLVVTSLPALLRKIPEKPSESSEKP